jgi:vacuolar-type H+-ATPase subunit E/Vma4
VKQLSSSDEKITLFLSAISENLEMRRKEIDDEMNAVRKAEQEKAELEADLQSKAYIKAETVNILKQAKRTQSLFETNLRSELATARNDIANRVFEAVEKKLASFTQTPDYADFLKKSVLQMQSVFGKNPMLLYVRTADLCHKDLLLSAAGTATEIVADATIMIGGCKAHGKSGNLALDDTLDSRLIEQRQSFYESSGLSV